MATPKSGKRTARGTPRPRQAGKKRRVRPWGHRDALGRLVANVAEAKTHFSDLLRRAERGEEIVLARDGEPLLRLSRLEPAPGPRTWGQMRGEFQVADDFDEWPPGFLDFVDASIEPGPR